MILKIWPLSILFTNAEDQNLKKINYYIKKDG